MNGRLCAYHESGHIKSIESTQNKTTTTRGSSRTSLGTGTKTRTRTRTPHNSSPVKKM